QVRWQVAPGFCPAGRLAAEFPRLKGFRGESGKWRGNSQRQQGGSQQGLGQGQGLRLGLHLPKREQGACQGTVCGLKNFTNLYCGAAERARLWRNLEEGITELIGKSMN